MDQACLRIVKKKEKSIAIINTIASFGIKIIGLDLIAYFLSSFLSISVWEKPPEDYWTFVGKSKFPIKWYCFNISTDILKNHWSKPRQWVSCKITFLKVSLGFRKYSLGKLFYTAQKVCNFLQISWHLLKKSLIESFFFCAVLDNWIFNISLRGRLWQSSLYISP